MEVNYILIYGNPYLQTKYFEKFDDISDYEEFYQDNQDLDLPF